MRRFITAALGVTLLVALVATGCHPRATRRPNTVLVVQRGLVPPPRGRVTVVRVPPAPVSRAIARYEPRPRLEQHRIDQGHRVEMPRESPARRAELPRAEARRHGAPQVTRRPETPGRSRHR